VKIVRKQRYSGGMKHFIRRAALNEAAATFLRNIQQFDSSPASDGGRNSLVLARTILD